VVSADPRSPDVLDAEVSAAAAGALAGLPDSGAGAFGSPPAAFDSPPAVGCSLPGEPVAEPDEPSSPAA
jgi:hypothetical protein